MHKIIGSSPVKSSGRIWDEKEGRFPVRGGHKFRFPLQEAIKLQTIEGRYIFHIIHLFKTPLDFKGANSGSDQFGNGLGSVEVFERKQMFIPDYCLSGCICQG